MLDCLHILRNVRKNLVNKESWKYFNQMIRERSVEAFNKTKLECLSTLKDPKDIALYKRFLLSARQYCFCFIPPVLFGFIPNTAMNEKLHDMIKGVIPYSKPFTVVVRKTLTYLEEIGLKCHEFELETITIKYEDILHYPPLK